MLETRSLVAVHAFRACELANSAAAAAAIDTPATSNTGCRLGLELELELGSSGRRANKQLGGFDAY